MNKKKSPPIGESQVVQNFGNFIKLVEMLEEHKGNRANISILYRPIILQLVQFENILRFNDQMPKGITARTVYHSQLVFYFIVFQTTVPSRGSRLEFPGDCPFQPENPQTRIPTHFNSVSPMCTSHTNSIAAASNYPEMVICPETANFCTSRQDSFENLRWYKRNTGSFERSSFYLEIYDPDNTVQNVF